jgi:hypothetical protein
MCHVEILFSDMMALKFDHFSKIGIKKQMEHNLNIAYQTKI